MYKSRDITLYMVGLVSRNWVREMHDDDLFH